EAASRQDSRAGRRQPRHERGGTSRAHRRASDAVRLMRGPREPDCRHRLRLRAGGNQPARASIDHVGEARSDGRRSAHREPRLITGFSMSDLRASALYLSFVLGVAILVAACGSGWSASKTSSERTEAAASVTGAHGIDEAAIDPSIVPGDDFFRYTNGIWLKKTAIP